MADRVMSSIRKLLRSNIIRGRPDRNSAVITKIRSFKDINEAVVSERKRQILFDYVELFEAVEEKERNILLDVGAERQFDGKELMKLAARRVGLEPNITRK